MLADIVISNESGVLVALLLVALIVFVFGLIAGFGIARQHDPEQVSCPLCLGEGGSFKRTGRGSAGNFGSEWVWCSRCSGSGRVPFGLAVTVGHPVGFVQGNGAGEIIFLQAGHPSNDPEAPWQPVYLTQEQRP